MNLLLAILFLIVLLLSNLNGEKLSIGVERILDTTENQNSIFIAPNGKGKVCSKTSPCNISRLDLFSKNRLSLKPKDIVFFRQGIYPFSMSGIKRIYLQGGKKGEPIIFEGYKDEKVIFDGSDLSRQDTNTSEWREGRLELRDNYTILRKVEVRNMPQHGIRIFGNYNIIEGCIVHNNGLSGIEIYNHKDGFSIKSTGGSFNLISNNIIYNNSDVNLTHHNYNNGGNADGITVHSGVKNIIKHNEVYGNSDDGIDTWKSMDTQVLYNRVYENGKGKEGDGSGIKLGGAGKSSPLGANSIARHNLIYMNKGSGININSGKSVTIEYNTSYKNKAFGYTLEDDTKLNFNISFNNKLGDFGWSKGIEQKFNSWQFKEKLIFQNLDKKSPLFLKPKKGIIHEKIGAYSKDDK